jgi:hypothetical protein
LARKIEEKGIHMTTQKRTTWLLFFTLSALMVSGCSLFPMSSATPLLMPSSTSVSTGQSLSFQVSGGTPPYQFQVNGVGSIDNSGNFQAGSSTGQAQIEVSDANGNQGSATVSVIQAGSTYGNTINTVSQSYAQGNLSLDQVRAGWSATSSTELKKTPLVQGQIVAEADRTIDPQGDKLYSEFIQTNLKHPLVRQDELIEGKHVVAVHAVIEDQFLVKLQSGYSESDLSTILSSNGAHISRRLTDPRTYLVSMGKQGAQSEVTSVSSHFLAKRDLLKQQLKTIATVMPNYISRVPAFDPVVNR